MQEPKETKRGLPSPHRLRDTYTTACNNAGVSAYDIEVLTNHRPANNSVTAGYISQGTDHLRIQQQKVAEYLKIRMGLEKCPRSSPSSHSVADFFGHPRFNSDGSQRQKKCMGFDKAHSERPMGFWIPELTEARKRWDEYIISFLGMQRGQSLLTGMYRIHGMTPKDGQFYYDLEEMEGYEDFVDRVVINWGSNARAWHQSYEHTKEVVEIIPKGSMGEFPGLLDFVLDYDELKRLTS